jgi:Ras GTPase-activating-like protein IQGAP2/3
MNIADRYVHPRQVPYVREAFQTIIREVIDTEDLDLEADPTVVRPLFFDLEVLSRSHLLRSIKHALILRK